MKRIHEIRHELGLMICEDEATLALNNLIDHALEVVDGRLALLEAERSRWASPEWGKEKRTRVLFTERAELCVRDANNIVEPLSVPTFLVATAPVLSYEDRHSEGGHDVCDVYLAWRHSRRGWLLRREWLPAQSYGCSGVEETFYDYEEGVRLLVEHGCFGTYECVED